MDGVSGGYQDGLSRRMGAPPSETTIVWGGRWQHQQQQGRGCPQLTLPIRGRHRGATGGGVRGRSRRPTVGCPQSMFPASVSETSAEKREPAPTFISRAAVSFRCAHQPAPTTSIWQEPTSGLCGTVTGQNSRGRCQPASRILAGRGGGVGRCRLRRRRICSSRPAAGRRRTRQMQTVHSAQSGRQQRTVSARILADRGGGVDRCRLRRRRIWSSRPEAGRRRRKPDRCRRCIRLKPATECTGTECTSHGGGC